MFLGILRPVISSYTSKIDLIITDMEMLRLNGADLCARLLEERPEIKALVMSGADTREIVSQNVDLPVPPRPFDGKTLIARVRALLSPATARRSSRRTLWVREAHPGMRCCWASL